MQFVRLPINEYKKGHLQKGDLLKNASLHWRLFHKSDPLIWRSPIWRHERQQYIKVAYQVILNYLNILVEYLHVKKYLIKLCFSKLVKRT